VGTLKNVRDTDKVHDYLRANNNWKIIPKVPETNTWFLIKITAILFFCRLPPSILLVRRA
jgi:hypothetical protein